MFLESLQNKNIQKIYIIKFIIQIISRYYSPQHFSIPQLFRDLYDVVIGDSKRHKEWRARQQWLEDRLSEGKDLNNLKDLIEVTERFEKEFIALLQHYRNHGYLLLEVFLIG